MGKIFKKIVLTGGPCSGKSSSLDFIKTYLNDKGYLVFICQESATELINSGIKSFGDNKLSRYSFDKALLKYQMDKERLIEDVAKSMPTDKDIIIIYDRGFLDSKAYVSEMEWDLLLNEYGLNEIDLLNGYDLVIHLESGSRGKFYTKENNTARSENASEAIELDKKTFIVWQKHRNLFRVKCYENFIDKQNEILKIIDNALYTNVRFQNKYLISLGESFIDDDVFYIKQYYLDIDDSYEYRLREVKYKESIRFYYTIQQKLESGKSIILFDSVITEEEFNKLLSENSIKKELCKIRKYITINDTQLNIDIFEDGTVILESAKKLEENIFGITEDVTDDNAYLNSNINIHSMKKEFTH